MTISSETRKAGPYAGNDVATVFPFAFKVFTSADLMVVKANAVHEEQTLVEASGYTVTLNSDQNVSPGGTVTLPTPLASGYTLTITSDVAQLQLTDLTNQGGFYPTVINNALDKLTILIQQLFDGVSRSLKFPLSDAAGGAPTLPSAADRAGMFLAFDAEGNPVAAIGTGADTDLRADLAAPGGSLLSGFRQSGDGVATRTVQAKLRELVSVKDFGAVGDGVADDTTAIQAALNLGGPIYFPSGTYLSSPLTCGDNTMLYGDGFASSKIKLKNASAGALLTATDAGNFSLSDLAFDANYANCPSGTYCVGIDGTQTGDTGYAIDACEFSNAKQIGVYQTGTYAKSSFTNSVVKGCQTDGFAFFGDNVLVQNNRCFGNGRFGILALGDCAQIIGNECANNGQLVTQGAGIGVINANYPVVTGNVCISNGTGAYFTHGIQFNTVEHGVMNSNFSQGNNGSGLDSYQSPYTTMTGNQSFANKLRGIENDTTSTYSTISGNIAYANYEIGISVYNTVGSVVANNIAAANGTLGTVTNPLTGIQNYPYGISVWGAGLYGSSTTLIGNQISQNDGSGSNGVGLFVEAPATDISLIGNKFSANTTDIDASKSSFFTVKDNQGVVTQQQGTVSLGASSTSASVTFSPALDFAPTASSIVISPLNVPYTNTGPVAITAVSATGFTLSVGTAPGSGGINFDWSVNVFP